jgi:hypothetical protein
MAGNIREEKGLITIAIGNKYIKQAKYLAYSAMLNAPNIKLAVITDKPEVLARFYDIIVPYNPDYGDPFATKTRLHLYTPFYKTVFVDSDSLIMNNIDSYWETLDQNSLVYEGKLISKGDWYFDVANVIKQLDLPNIPKINSGFLLFKNDETAKSVFDVANDCLINQKEKGLNVDFFRGKMLPDEPFLSIAFAKHNIPPFQDYGRFSRCLNGISNLHIDVIKRVSFFIFYGRRVNPLIVHFTGRFGQFLLFIESVKLFFYFNPPVRTAFLSVLALIRKIYKYFFVNKGKTYVW